MKLPWKEGQDILHSNYELSLSRMKGQVKKLRKEPEVLREYDSVIKEQFASGVIERVVELERSGGVHYISHLAVIAKKQAQRNSEWCMTPQQSQVRRAPH